MNFKKIIVLFCISTGASYASGTYKLPTKIDDAEIQKRLASICKKNPNKIFCKKLKLKK